MRRTLCFLAALVLSFALSASVCDKALADGKLQKFKEAAQAQKKSSSKPKSDRREKKEHAEDIFDDDDDDEEYEGFWNQFFGELFAAMFTAMGEAVKEEVFSDHGVRYRAFPYNKESYVFHACDKIPRAPGVLRTQYQRINPDLYGLTWRLTLRMPSGWDFACAGTYYDEKLRSGDHDHLNFTRMRLNRLCSPLGTNLLVRAGLGLADLHGSSGLDLGAELDWFFHKPFTLRAGLNHSFVGRSRGVTDIDVAFGVMAGPFEFSLGYRGLITKGEQIDGVYISIGFWF